MSPIVSFHLIKESIHLWAFISLFTEICIHTAGFVVWMPTFSAVRTVPTLSQQLGPQDFVKQTLISGSSSVVSHWTAWVEREPPLGRFQSRFAPLFSSSFPSVLAQLLLFTMIHWNIPSSLTHSSLAAGKLFTGISDTPCPWITLGSREITAFCRLACWSLVLADRIWMCQTGGRGVDH